jgi:hypothetical protein
MDLYRGKEIKPEITKGGSDGQGMWKKMPEKRNVKEGLRISHNEGGHCKYKTTLKMI